ncbi:MAG: xylose isomerase, partial [Sphaerochaetaceae bacterium]
YGRKIGFTGNFYIEPKPMEPTKHQYDFDALAACAFIKEQGLEKDFSCNIESNHATLAGHSFAHDLQVCVDHDLLGSVDANQGDPQNGWDTDEFPTNVYETTEAMLIILRNGGLKKGGLNFDAKRRRNSVDLQDLFIAHIGGMDAFAIGLETAAKMLADGKIERLRKERYASFDSGDGKRYEEGKFTFEELAEVGRKTDIKQISGQQELYNNLVNQYLFDR